MDRSPATFLALLVGGVLLVGYFVQKKTHPDGGPTTDPAVLASDFARVETAINAAKGKVVLIDCWATWCGPCVSSFPKLVEKSEKYGPQGLVVVTVNLNDADEADEVKEFLKQQRATFTNIQLKRDEASFKGLKKRLDYGGGIPHAALFDRSGARVWTGHPEDPALEARLQEELAKPAPAP
jgi:thiol-disulfide isomerase/thioredoxin